MAFVYWIRLPEHTDMFTQGYIGVTKRSVERRYSEHLRDTRRWKTKLYNAMLKYEEKVFVQTLVECDIDYAYALEEKLRPQENIGWNTAQGGQLKFLALAPRERSPEYRRKISDSLKNQVWRDESRQKLSQSLKLFYKENPMPPKGPANPESIAKRERTRFKTSWGKNPSIWQDAHLMWYWMLDNPGIKVYKAAKILGFFAQPLRVVFRQMKAGWNPSEDVDWIEWCKTIKLKETPIWDTH